MSQRTLSIALLSAALAFAGGYALLGALQPAGNPAVAGSGASDPTKVVAIPGSALVPVGDGSTDWMLIGPDGTLLAGPDGRPPETSTTAGAPGTAELSTSLAPRQDNDLGVYLVNFVPEGTSKNSRDDRDRDRNRHEDDDHDDHDDYDYDDDHGDDDDDDRRRDREESTTTARFELPRLQSKK